MAYEEGSTAEERERKRREEAKRKLEEARLRRERERQTQTQVDKTREEAAYARGQSQANVQVDKTREEARPVGQQTAGQRGYDPRFDDPDYGKSKQDNRPRQQQQASPQQSSLSSLKPPEEREQVTASTRSYEDAGMTDTLDQRRAAEREQAQQEARRQPETQYRYYTPTTGMQQQYQPPQGQIQTGGLSSLKPLEERQALYQGQQAAEQMGMGDTWNMQQQAQRNFAQEQARYEQENPQEPGQSWLGQAGQYVSDLWGQNVAGFNRTANAVTGAYDQIQQTPGFRAAEQRREQRWKDYYESAYDKDLPTVDTGIQGNPLIAGALGVINPALGNTLANIDDLANVWNAGAGVWDKAADTSVGKQVEAAGQYVGRTGSDILDTIQAGTTDLVKTETPVGQWAGAAIDAAINPTEEYNQGGLMESMLGATPLPEIITTAQKRLQQYANLQQRIESSTNPDADFAELNYYSGPQAAEDTLRGVENQESNVTTLRQQATQAYYDSQSLVYTEEERKKLQLRAAELGAQAEELANKTAFDYVDENTNVLRELGATAVLDPLNLVGPISKVLGLMPDAFKLREAQQLIGAADMNSIVKLDEALKNFQKAENLAGTGMSTWDKIYPLAATADNRAMQGASAWFSSMAQILGGVENQQDAARLINTLVDNPQALAQGVDGLTSQSLVNRAVDGLVQFGEGIVGNQRLIDNADVLAAATDDLRKATGVGADGRFNPLRLMGQVYEALSNASNKVHGVRTELNGAEKLLGLEKQFLSEAWLGMRPANWIQNAANATATLMTDGIMTLASNDTLLDALKKKNAIVPIQRIAEAHQGVSESIRSATQLGQVGMQPGQKSIFRNVPVVGKVLGAWAEKGLDIAYGTGVIGEDSFYLKGYASAFQKNFTPVWKEAVQGGLMPALTNLGIDEATAKRLANIAQDVGANGSRDDIQDALRAWVNNNSSAYSLEELGIPEGALSQDGVLAVYDVLFNSAGMSQDDYIKAMDNVFDAESRVQASILNQAPPQMGRYKWTETEIAQDGADFIDDAVKTARRAGQDPMQAQQEATAMWQASTEAEKFAYATLQDDLVQSTPGALNVAVDTWAQVSDLKSTYRAKQGELYEKAAAANNPQAWGEYWQSVRKMWGEDYAKELQAISDGARTDINALANGGEVQRRYNYWDRLERQARIDEGEVMRARQLNPMSQATDSENYKRAIEAGRQFVDSYATRAYAAVRKFATNDSMDIVFSAEGDINRMGQQVAAYVGGLRDQFLGNTLDAVKYYEQRNQAWYEFADSAAARWNIATREIVEAHAAQQVPSQLRWVDEFAGGEFQLQRIEGSTAYAKRLDDGSIHKFNVGAENSGRPDVPQNVLDDYKSISGGNTSQVVEDTLQQVIEEANAAAPPVTPAYSAMEMPTGTQQRQAIQYQAQQEAISAREARTTMRSEWDRVAKAELGFPGIDAAIMNYKRDGVVKFGENFPYEDLLGRSIGGYQLDTQADVERLLTEYSSLMDKATTAEGQGRSLRQYERMTPQELAEAVPDAFEGFTPQDIAQMNQEEALAFVAASEGMEAPSDVYDTLDKMRQYRNENPYDIPSTGIDFGGLNADTAATYDAVAESGKMRANTGGAWTPSTGEIAGFNQQQLDKAYQKLINAYQQIAQAPAGQLTEAQKLRAMDEMKKFLGPAWDNAVATTSEAAKQIADFSMLDMTNRTNLDKWISYVVPYHYWSTRSMKNWARRTMTRPDVAALYYKVQDAVETENQQSDLPTRAQGTVPVPGTDYRIRNPINKILPFGMYAFNDFAAPEESNNAISTMTQTAQMFGFGLRPTLDFAVDAYSNYVETGDVKDALGAAYNQNRPGQLFQPLQMANYTYQAFTGKPLPYGMAGDQWDEYRVGREIAAAAERGEVPTDKIKWGQDIGYQILNKTGPLPEQPADAQAIWEKAAQDAGFDRGVAIASSFFLGLGIYEVDPAETALRNQSAGYGNMGYDAQSNPFGSATAKDEYLNENENLTGYWSKNSLIPGSDGQRPGEGAAKDDYWAQVQPVLDQQTAEVDQWLIENPNATWEEVRDFKEQYKEKILAINDDFPTVGDDRIYDGEGGNQPPKHRSGESPIERSLTDIDTILHYADNLPGKPKYPGEDASREEKNAYYDALDAYTSRQLDYVENNLGKMAGVGPEQQPGTMQPGMREGFGGQELANDITGSHVVGQYAADLLRMYQKRFEGDVELMWSERLDLAKEFESSLHDNVNGAAAAQFGDDIVGLADSYPSRAKGGTDADRQQWLAAHGGEEYARLQQYWGWKNSTYGNYNEVATQLFGPDILDVAASYPGSEASKEEKRAWFEAQGEDGARRIKEFWDWRGEYFDRINTEAPQQFGDDILELAKGYVSKAEDPEGNAAWMAEHGSPDYQRLQQYWAWRDDYFNQTAPSLQEAWGQPRPYGGNRQPIGGEGAVAPPMPGLDQFAADPQAQADINSTFAPGGPMGPTQEQMAASMGPQPQGQMFQGWDAQQGPPMTGQAPPLPTQPVTPQQQIQAAQAQGSISPEVYKGFTQTPANQPITAFGNPPTEQKETSGEGGAGTGTGANSTVLDAWKKWLAENGGGGGGRGYGGGGGGGTSLRTFASVRNELLNRALYVQMGMREYRAPQLPNYYLADKSRNLEPGRMEDWLRFTRIKLS